METNFLKIYFSTVPANNCKRINKSKKAHWCHYFLWPFSSQFSGNFLWWNHRLLGTNIQSSRWLNWLIPSARGINQPHFDYTCQDHIDGEVGGEIVRRESVSHLLAVVPTYRQLGEETRGAERSGEIEGGREGDGRSNEENSEIAATLPPRISTPPTPCRREGAATAK